MLLKIQVPGNGTPVPTSRRTINSVMIFSPYLFQLLIYKKKKELSEEQFVEEIFKRNLWHRFYTKMQCSGSGSGRIRIISEAGSGSALE
jgi:hypothetical protein